MGLWLRSFGLFIVLFSNWVPAMAGEMEQTTNTEFFRFCKYGTADFETLEAEFIRRFPVGSKAERLIETIGQSTGYEALWEKKPWPPAESGEALAHYIYVYAYPCPLYQENKNYWHFIFITDLKDNITKSEFRLFFVDENFKTRGIPFKFENFRSREEARKALWSLTGEGTTRNAVEELMSKVGLKRQKVKSNQNIDKYRKNSDTRNLGHQLSGYGTWVLLWEFDDNGRLKRLR